MTETAGVTAEVELNERGALMQLTGPGNAQLKILEGELGVELGSRGNVLRLGGEPDKVAFATRFFEQIDELASEGVTLDGQDHVRALHALRNDAELHLRDIYTEVIIQNARGRPIKARGLAQKQYLRAMRNNDLTFGVGPAGTGKTYLAMAMAVQALAAKKVRRIILTRPAVEAGEKLGFLPGDLEEKVNPYLRPLYDALDDMMPAAKVDQLLKHGQIEVAPLAFMRGRAQPYFARVLTPDGFVPIGCLKVGDHVIGSDGKPTRVSGVYPQGKREIYRVTAQDGATTLCCREHLWAVKTLEDLSRNAPARVLETREMIGSTERFHLPLLSAPAELTSAVPRPKVVGSDLVRTDASADALVDSTEARLAQLQDHLDASGVVVVKRGACHIHSTFSSEKQRRAITFLVRSLGGVALRRGAVVDIRLPAGIHPFRHARKLETYEASRGGHPTRYIDRIEPAGEQDCLCIRVDAADSLYVTDDFLVTHNTLNDCFVILDEAQNSTVEQMRMFLTRLGYESQAVVTGDVTQVDLPTGRRSGLRDAWELLKDVEGIAMCRFTEVDVVRHPLVQRIVVAYEQRDEALRVAKERLKEARRAEREAQAEPPDATESLEPIAALHASSQEAGAAEEDE